MTSQVIPAEAVEAAAITILDVTPEVWELQDAEVQTEIRIDATRILEAAAPHMLAHKVEPVEAIVTKGPWEPLDTAEWWKPHARSCNVFRAPRADCDCGEEIP